MHAFRLCAQRQHEVQTHILLVVRHQWQLHPESWILNFHHLLSFKAKQSVKWFSHTVKVWLCLDDPEIPTINMPNTLKLKKNTKQLLTRNNNLNISVLSTYFVGRCHFFWPLLGYLASQQWRCLDSAELKEIEGIIWPDLHNLGHLNTNTEKGVIINKWVSLKTVCLLVLLYSSTKYLDSHLIRYVRQNSCSLFPC